MSKTTTDLIISETLLLGQKVFFQGREFRLAALWADKTCLRAFIIPTGSGNGVSVWADKIEFNPY